jgi:hypothetical protein
VFVFSELKCLRLISNPSARLQAGLGGQAVLGFYTHTHTNHTCVLQIVSLHPPSPSFLCFYHLILSTGNLEPLTQQTALISLIASNNLLEGSLAPVVNMSRLTTLQLANNQFRGTAGPFVKGLTALMYVHCECKLHDRIGCCRLTLHSVLLYYVMCLVLTVRCHSRLDLSHNFFSDSIAVLSASFPLFGLQQLNLGNNRMTGSALVIDATKFHRLSQINISYNMFSSVYTVSVDDHAFGIFDARGNNFDCPLPPWPLGVKVTQDCHQSLTSIGLTLVCIGSLFSHCYNMCIV